MNNSRNLINYALFGGSTHFNKHQVTIMFDIKITGWESTSSNTNDWIYAEILIVSGHMFMGLLR